MKHFLGFTYDGIPSMHYGIMQVNVGGGLYDDTLMSSTSIESDTVKGRDVSFFKNITRENIKLTMSLYMEHGVDERQLDIVRAWFDVDYYKPLYFDERPDRLVFAMIEGEVKLRHDGYQGYLEVTLATNSPYWWSPIHALDFKGATTFNFTNTGTKSLFPMIEITAKDNISSGSPVKVINVRTGQSLEVTQMASGEVLTVDCMYESLQSSLPETYRYDVCNENYLEIETGVSPIQLVGNASFKFRYREKYR